MKNLIALAIMSMVAQNQAVKLRAKDLSLPDIKITDPAKLVAAIQGGLKEARGEIAREVAGTWKDCYTPDGSCVERERGLIRDIRRANEDVVEGMERGLGIDFSKNVYDPKFLTDLIMAEYDDFVKQFNAHVDQVKGMLAGLPAQAKADFDKLGLAQLKEDAPCWRQFEDANPMPQGNVGREYWDERRTKEDAFMTTCYSTQSALAKSVSDNLPPPEAIVGLINQGIAKLSTDLKDGAADIPQELAHQVEGLNHMLESEAKRVGMTAPSLPDPTDTGAKLFQALTKAAEMASSADVQKEIAREVPRARADTIKEAYRFERDLKRAADPRGGQMAAEGLKHVGIDVSADSINAFTAGLVAKVEEIGKNPQEGAALVNNVAHMF